MTPFGVPRSTISKSGCDKVCHCKSTFLIIKGEVYQ